MWGNKSFTQGFHSSTIFRSCSARVDGAWAAVFLGACWEPAVLEPCKPHLLSGTDHNSGSGIEGVAAFAGSSDFRLLGEFFWGWAAAVAGAFWSLLTAFFESAGCPKEVASTLQAASPKKPKAR